MSPAINIIEQPGRRRRKPGPLVFTLGLTGLLAAFWLPPAGLAAERLPAEEEAAQADSVEIVIQGPAPITIRAETIEHDGDRDLAIFLGRVTLIRGPETITADRAVWHNATGSAELAGNVRLEAPDFTVLAERAVVNLELSLAKIYRGRAFFPRNNYYLSGAVIERLGEKEFRIEDGTATTCDGPNPAWTLQADHLTVTESGYASATGVIFKGAGSAVPLFASPYFIFPVKNERQSGLLTPTFGSSSSDGFTAGLPFFWATGENHDLTFTPVWRDKRGLTTSVEGRYHLTRGRGLWQASYLKDQADRLYTTDRGDTKKAEERFWLRAQNQWRAGEWDLNLNLDLVSDPLYLREFAAGPEGIDRSRNDFYKDFGYTVNESLNPNRANELYAQRLGYDTQTRAGLHYTQNLYRDHNRDTLQRLPSLQYDLVSHSLGEAGSPDDGRLRRPRLSLSTRYDYFYRTADDISFTDETGHRIWLGPRLDWNTPLGGLANFQASGGLELASYAAEGRRPSDDKSPAGREAARHDQWDSRLTGAADLELSTTFSRVFDGGPGRAAATRHQFSPTVTFTYVGAPEDQGRLPYWDPLDRRLPRRALRYGLSNTLVSKTENEQDSGAGYFQFLKFGLWTGYEFADNSHLTDRQMERYYDVNYYGQGSTPLEVEIETFFNPYLSARLISAFDTRTGRAGRHDLNLNLSDDRGDKLTLTYDYDSPESALNRGGFNGYQEARADLTLNLDSEWSTRLFTRFDLLANRSLETTAQITYRAQCYGLGLIYSKTYADQSVGLMVDLLGLGTIGFSGGLPGSAD